MLVTVERDGPVAVVTMNRPEAMNALSRGLRAQLAQVMKELDGEERIRAVVLTGAGTRAFTAGLDLKELGVEGLGAANASEPLANPVKAIEQCRKPVIGAINGVAITGGFEVALAGDIILAGESASFADTHGKFALVPVWGMSQRLPRRVGQWKAREISFTGLPVSGVEAARIGLANACVPDAELEARTIEMAEAIAAQSRHSVFAYKRLYTAQADLPLEAGLAYEIVNSAGVGPDMAERVSGRFG